VGSRINIKCFSPYSWDVWEAAMVPLSVLILALVICQGGGLGCKTKSDGR